jgi:broad specificity phosphatase PhoE
MIPDLSTSNLWSVRHAETEWNRRKVFMGCLDVPATPAGLSAAAALGARLCGQVDHVFSSPLSRAASTAAAMFPGFPITLDTRLRERGMGAWEGHSKDAIRRVNPWAFPRSYLDPTVTPRGGEALASLIARVRGFLDDIAPLCRHGRVVLVSHNGWIRAAQYLGQLTTLDEFHVHPVRQLVVTRLRVPSELPYRAAVVG